MFIKRCNVQVNVLDTTKTVQNAPVVVNFTDEEIKESIKKAAEQINKIKSEKK